MKTKKQMSGILLKASLLSMLLGISFSLSTWAQTCNKQTANAEKKDKNQILQEACEKGDLELVKKLVEVKGVSVNTIIEPDNHSMLMFAAWNGHADLSYYLLEKGADVSIVNKGNNTAFHDAVIKGHIDIAKAILDKGADINQKASWGFSPLHMACQKGKPEMAQFLVDNGADVNQTDAYERPPIMVASWKGNAETIKLLVDKGADVNFKTKGNNSILHNLARGGHVDAIKIVLANNGNANVQDENGYLPLHAAVKNQHSKAAKILAENTKNINTKEKIKGNTALHLAAINGNKWASKILLEAGADSKITNKDKNTSIDYAVKYGHVSLVDLYINENLANQQDHDLALKSKEVINQPVANGEARVNYAGHSGWIIQTSDKVIVFDYWANNKPYEGCLANGSFCPKEMKDKEVFVFASHAHGDHYDTIIHSWAQEVKNINYIYGFNPNDAWVNKKSGYHGPEYKFIQNNSTENISGVKITTLKSNDSGQGYLVEADGVSIFHPGDHAWFSAEDEEIFKKEVDYIQSVNNKVDIAFLPVSGCPSRWQKEFIVQGFNYSIDQLNPTTVYPMHAFGREHTLTEFEDLAKKAKTPTQVLCAENTGDSFSPASENMASK